MKKKTPWYDLIEISIIVVLFSCMTLILFASVVSRYCFSFTFSWAEQLTRVMFVWITFAGISLAGKRGAHMRVTAITLVIGEKKGKYVFWLGDLITIVMALRRMRRMPNPLRADLRFAAKIVPFGIVSMITTLMTTLNYRVDTLMMGYMFGVPAAEIGF